MDAWHSWRSCAASATLSVRRRNEILHRRFYTTVWPADRLPPSPCRDPPGEQGERGGVAIVTRVVLMEAHLTTVVVVALDADTYVIIFVTSTRNGKPGRPAALSYSSAPTAAGAAPAGRLTYSALHR